ncbi:MAG: LptF/LptG family permease [Phycisphaerales bacterium]|nr:LptF/LptG family permease [Phycisphaerales bacterium]
MNKTLSRYIGLDLLKCTGLTLVVLTLTLTTLGIIEPLRKQGLDASQVFLIFTITLPVMLSFTLPFAALFAACFVYGRFSQDNEFLASKASGISIFSLLRPAICLGIAVTVTSLCLSNFLAPIMARRGADAITNNIRGLMCRKLASNGFLSFKGMTIHADRVHQYDDRPYDKLQGVVVVKSKNDDSGDVEIMSAKSARTQFGINHKTLRAFVNITLDEAVIVSSSDPSVRTQTTCPLESVSFDRRIKEKPAWYSWAELQERLVDPSKSITVQQTIVEIQQAVCNDIFVKHIRDELKARGQYDKLTRHDARYIIKAPHAEPGGSGELILKASTGEKPLLIEIIELDNGKPKNKITASNAIIKMTWDAFTKKPEISLTLDQDVKSTDLTTSHPGEIAKAKGLNSLEYGQIRIPDDVAAKIADVTPHEAYHNIDGLTGNEAIRKKLSTLKNKHVVRLIMDIEAEKHMRLAFGVSCLLMVMLGGVLGLIFKGGQFVSALFTSTVPAATVVITILMGKNLAQNPDVMRLDGPSGSLSLGVIVIWGGIGLLTVATGLIYWRVSKK